MNLIAGTTVLETTKIPVRKNPTYDMAIAGISDFDGDGRADMLFRNNVNNAWFIYMMNGSTILANTRIDIPFNSSWQ